MAAGRRLAIVKSNLSTVEQEKAGSPADAVLFEIAGLLVAHLALALAICLVLDLCGA